MKIRHWLSRSVATSKAAYRVDPKRTAFTAGCFLAALLLLAGGTANLAFGGGGNELAGANGDAGTAVGPRSPVSGLTGPLGTAAPSTTAGPGDPTTTSTPGPGEPGGPAPAGVATPPGGVSWTNTSNSGLRLSVSASKPVVSTGEAVRFNATVEDSSGGITALVWDFGDGNKTTTDVKSCADVQNRTTVDTGRTSFTASATHAFRNPGDYNVSVMAQTGARCGSRAASDSVIAVGSVKVVGDVVANGTAQPTVNVSIRTGGMSNDPLLGLSIRASDVDGYISSIIVNWDDDAAPTVINYPLASCANQANGLPSSSRLEMPERNYTLTNSYDVTVTVTSVGCNGGQAQQAIGVLNGVNVGGVTSQGGDGGIVPTIPSVTKS